jgi:multidrug efflux pump subunit AcrA (membrane-fusion protein)
MASPGSPEFKSRWWPRSLFVLGMIAAVATSVALIAGVGSSQDEGPKLTHTVTRGDLLVTVTAQGILESSENVEIKCQVRGFNTIIWVIESGSMVEAGDELVRLDSLLIEEQIDERTKYAHWSQSAADRSEATVASSALAVTEYEEGTYVSELMTLEKDLAVAESNLVSARNILEFTELLHESRYIGEIELEQRQFEVQQAELSVELLKTRIKVLKQFTQAEMMQTLKGNLAASLATHKANDERARADASRRDRAIDEHKLCVIRAERPGLVIHRSAAEWMVEPITEGSTVHKDQVLLLMPDLTKMRVKVGVHESDIDRMQVGLSATVTLPDRTIEGKVSEVALVTTPTGWWTGNEVKYDTFVNLPAVPRLKPGMSAEVEILVAEREGVLSIPVAAIVETDAGSFCWIKTADGVEKRQIQLGDSNDVFTIVEEGLEEGEEVVLNPSAFRAVGTTAKKKTPSDKALSQDPSDEKQSAVADKKPTTKKKPVASENQPVAGDK